MKKKCYLLTLLIGCLIGSAAFSQDTLPKFSVRNAGNNRIIIGWVNPFPELKQISIQRSHDSLNNYKTILSVADPRAVQNGYVDTKAPNDHMYYRIFYVMQNNYFFFTEAKQPRIDTAKAAVTKLPIAGDTAVRTAPVVVKKPEYVPSFYVYSKTDGNVFINLPDADQKAYSIKFYEEDDSYLFEIKGIKETALILDKANFHHGGWFKFELYSGDKIVERHKFFIGKNF